MVFRKHILSSGREIYSGKDSATNDELVRSSKDNEKLLHTKKPGSPFVNCGENPSIEELKEGAIFCAKYSQAWRDNKGDVEVSIFLKKDMKKELGFKEGTWEVKGKEMIRVKKADILAFERKMLGDKK